MPHDQTSCLFIVGAGFSSHAGLPLAREFTQALLDLTDVKSPAPSREIVDYLRKFVGDTFGTGSNPKSDQWPPLEDIFTLIDLSANTGHNLGPKYPAAELRNVRRALIVRIIRMLTARYGSNECRNGDKWRQLDSLFARIEVGKVAFLSLNWDTVIEQQLMLRQKVENFDYGCDARSATFNGDQLDLTYAPEAAKPVLHLLKPHGSINWLYCDACRNIFLGVPGPG